ncbi:ISXoo16 transposase [Plesiocystis pacifica SIR-1]|uniref:ISXoo16 transposase n=1 Tax=Plesiocystis pacifica SIR-1 TaxID=391625 RepID=A6FXX7_9BACT|nr:helix-turn-helix domain-containing protein [Plesiocystis pacifica]EDM81715.1 ISXoo16 transposase [Plesiocystis pacifica SIR-1]
MSDASFSTSIASHSYIPAAPVAPVAPVSVPRVVTSPSRSRRIQLSAEDRVALEKLADPNSEDETLRLRARIILSWARGATGMESAAELDTSRRTVTKWRTRFRKGGVAALSDRPRPGAPRTVRDEQIAEVLRLRSAPPPAGKSRWTTRMIAKETGLSQSTVVRIAREYAC